MPTWRGAMKHQSASSPGRSSSPARWRLRCCRSIWPWRDHLPVTARDILAQVELASGLGLIRDAVTIANDASASLSQKVALFGASAVMTPQDRERLDSLLAAVERGQSEALEGVPVLEAPEAAERAELAVKAAQNGHAHPLALGPGR